MKVTLKGTVVDRQQKSGKSAKGTWSATTIVLESGDKYKDYFPITFFGNNEEKVEGIKTGDQVEIDGYLGGRKHEKEGKTSYFTEIKGFECSLQRDTTEKPKASKPASVEDESQDDMPF